MTNRIFGLTVTLDADYRTDDVPYIVDKISRIRGVADVTEHVATYQEYMHRARIFDKLRDKALALFPDDQDRARILALFDPNTIL